MSRTAAAASTRSLSDDPGEACLYLSTVMHRRAFPVRYRFSYRVLSVLLDIDALPRLAARIPIFSHNRWNLVSFHDRDHGPRDGTPLRPWIDRVLAARGIDLAGGAVRLLCFPRILGYAFTPLSLWYCQHADGSLRAVLCEVRNTFGEQHGYLLHEAGQPMDWPVRADRRKSFHVSPFISMDARYRFRLACPADKLNIQVHEFQHERLMLSAAQVGVAAPFTTRALSSALLRMPLVTLKVMLAIHWQALKIWFARAPFHRKPCPPRELVS